MVQIACFFGYDFCYPFVLTIYFVKQYVTNTKLGVKPQKNLIRTKSIKKAFKLCKNFDLELEPYSFGSLSRSVSTVSLLIIVINYYLNNQLDR